ncbi:MAG: nucleotidyltransferase family protein [Thermodesulfovibrio sp.]|nr:nucleotidyltransferase family protein [Thermodesulfovibrio sp.]
MMIKECLILAGGLGTRLRGVINDIPKPMAPISGKPFLEFLLRYLSSQGMERIVLSVGYLKEKIIEHFGSNFMGMEIVYSVEEEPLGTGGAILKARDLLGEAFFVLNGDTLFMIDLRELYEFYARKCADVVIALRKMEDCSRYGSVVIDQDGRIKGFIEKGKMGECLINGGVYVVSKGILDKVNFPVPFSWERDFLERYYEDFNIYGLLCEGYFIDIGTPEDYGRANDELPRLDIICL